MKIKILRIILLLLQTTIFTFAAPIDLEQFFDWSSGGYTLKSNSIICNNTSKTLTSKKSYDNYILEFDFLLPAGGNNGIGILYTPGAVPHHDGIELQILDNSAKKYKNLKPYQYHGSAYELHPAKLGFLKPLGSWNNQRVTVYGPKVSVELNGSVINSFDLRELEKQEDIKSESPHKGIKKRSGHICLIGHKSPVEFRDFDLTILPKWNTLSVDHHTEFHDLLDSKITNHWVYPKGYENHWVFSKKKLRCNGNLQTKGKHLWTKKSYKDVQIIIQWRWTSPTPQLKNSPILNPNTGEAEKDSYRNDLTTPALDYNSGIYLRGSSQSEINLCTWTCGSGEVYGYRKNKKLPLTTRSIMTPKFNADHPIGEWNQTEIILQGNCLNVTQNNIHVIRNAILPDIQKEGKIAIQDHGSSLEFRQFIIKELPRQIFIPHEEN